MRVSLRCIKKGLVLFLWSCRRDIGIENVGDGLPLAIRLLFPDFNQLAVVLLRFGLRILGGDLIGSHYVGQVARWRDVGLGYLPRDGGVGSEHGSPHGANGSLARGDGSI